MSIDRIIPNERRIVAWLNAEIPQAGSDAFKARGYTPVACNGEDLKQAAFLNGLAAVFIAMDQAKPLQFLRDIEAHARLLLIYDCRVIVMARLAPGYDTALINTLESLKLPIGRLSPTYFARFRGWQNVEGDPPLPHVRLYDLDHNWDDIANFISDHPPDRPPNTDVVVEPKDSFSSDQLLLLQRAFGDCAEVHLQPMDDGRSKADVYRVHARIDGYHGGWNQPFFMKIGTRSIIIQEYINYSDKVDPYVPFHLGPNLVRSRCCLGAHDGVIVGDYVEESESLKSCAADGRAVQAISGLFDRTLRGWYRNYQPNDKPLMDQPGARVPEQASFPAGRIALARQIGATMTLPQFDAAYRRYVSTPWLRGPIHGDLHATNVRVRATDAIVIDFFAHKDGLILRDIARLEVSLLIDAFKGSPFEDPQNPATFDGKKWFDSIVELYRVNPTGNDVRHHEDPKSPSFWFHTCARQIRLHARQFERARDQYGSVLSLELLVKSSKNGHVSPFEGYRRAAAYYLAELMIQATQPVAAANTAPMQGAGGGK